MEIVKSRAELLEMKQRCGKSWFDLEKETGIPASTIRNHLTGKVAKPNPNIVDAAAAVMQDPANVAESLPESGCDGHDTLQTMHKVHNEMLNMSSKLYEQQLAQANEALRKSEKRCKWLTITLVAITVFLIFILMLDILNRDIGWFRYTTSWPVTRKTVKTALLSAFRIDNFS